MNFYLTKNVFILMKDTNMKTKPEWLQVPYFDNEQSKLVTSVINELNLNTVCIEANCPNRGECFSGQTATFMILGTNCTRNCTFCNVSHGKPQPVDEEEPARIAKAVQKLILRYAVITSVTRDDLSDGGARHFANVVHAIHKASPETVVETLIPDLPEIKVLAEEKPAVISHNIETVKSLYAAVRPEADYSKSLEILYNIKQQNPGILSKSGIMLGLGETHEELLEAFDDLLNAGCELLTIGQYLPPSKKHYPLQAYIEPDVFSEYGEIAKQKGFRYVASAPFVRSSYKAEEAVRSI